jgi:hypothetical protein
MSKTIAQIKKTESADKAKKVEKQDAAETIEEKNPLTSVERKNLEAYEETIRAHNESFVEAGLALGSIGDQKLHRETYQTFEEYCAEQWGWGRQYVYKLIKAASAWKHLKEEMTPIGDMQLPKNESQVRELLRLGDDKKQWVLGWKKAVKLAKTRTVTAAIVEKAVDSLLEKDEDADEQGEVDAEEDAPASQLELALTFIEKVRKKIKTITRDEFEECLGELYVLIEGYVKDLAK